MCEVHILCLPDQHGFVEGSIFLSTTQFSQDLQTEITGKCRGLYPIEAVSLGGATSKTDVILARRETYAAHINPDPRSTELRET